MNEAALTISVWRTFIYFRNKSFGEYNWTFPLHFCGFLLMICREENRNIEIFILFCYLFPTLSELIGFELKIYILLISINNIFYHYLGNGIIVSPFIHSIQFLGTLSYYLLFFISFHQLLIQTVRSVSWTHNISQRWLPFLFLLPSRLF